LKFRERDVKARERVLRGAKDEVEFVLGWNWRAREEEKIWNGSRDEDGDRWVGTGTGKDGAEGGDLSGDREEDGSREDVEVDSDGGFDLLEDFEVEFLDAVSVDNGWELLARLDRN